MANYYAYGFKPKEPDTRWKNSETWVCLRHVPPARLPASVERCWLCSSVRPPVKVETPPEPEVVPEPSKQDKRRGATSQVECHICGRVLWRRPQEIENSKTGKFQCGKAQRCLTDGVTDPMPV